jgi:hypothetical protein
VPLLAIVCLLHERNYPVPVRWRLAEAIGTTKDAVDSARSTAIAEGEITEVMETRPGRVSHRSSITRLRRLIPSDELWQLYQGAVAARKSA